jgi:hypothetical protein
MKHVNLFSEEGRQAAMSSVRDLARDDDRRGAAQQGKPHPRTYQKAPYSAFSEAVALLQQTPHALCERLGYSSTVFHSWQEEGLMPKVAAVAVTQMMMLHAATQNQAKGPRIALLKISSEEQWTTVHTVCTALGIKIYLPLE